MTYTRPIESFCGLQLVPWLEFADSNCTNSVAYTVPESVPSGMTCAVMWLAMRSVCVKCDVFSQFLGCTWCCNLAQIPPPLQKKINSNDKKCKSFLSNHHANYFRQIPSHPVLLPCAPASPALCASVFATLSGSYYINSIFHRQNRLHGIAWVPLEERQNKLAFLSFSCSRRNRKIHAPTHY